MDLFLRNKAINEGGGAKCIAKGIVKAGVFLLSARSTHTTRQLVYVNGSFVHLNKALVNESKMFKNE